MLTIIANVFPFIVWEYIQQNHKCRQLGNFLTKENQDQLKRKLNNETLTLTINNETNYLALL